MAIPIDDELRLEASLTGSVALAKIDHIQGAFRVFTTAQELQNHPIEQAVNDQIVWLESSQSLYQATVTPASPPVSFFPTLSWSAFTFPGGGGGGTPATPLNSVQFNDNGSFGGDPRFIFEKSTGLAQISGSFHITSSTASDIFLIKSGSIEVTKVNNDGVFVLGVMNPRPAAVEGGIVYSSSAFYVGVE